MEYTQLIEKLVQNAIEGEYCRVQDENFSDMNDGERKEIEHTTSMIISLQKQLLSMLPEEGHDLYIKLDTLVGTNLLLESRYMFKKGVIVGLTDLAYLKETDSCLCLSRIEL